MHIHDIVCSVQLFSPANDFGYVENIWKRTVLWQLQHIISTFILRHAA